MFEHYYSNFLNDAEEYRASERYWMNLWNDVAPQSSPGSDWKFPWVSTGSPDYLDGNPIFSGISHRLRRGVRIIQHAPTANEPEIQSWLDFVGINLSDPMGINELVVACALSNAVVDDVRWMLQFWAKGEPIRFGGIAGDLTPVSRRPPSWIYPSPSFRPAA